MDNVTDIFIRPPRDDYDLGLLGKPRFTSHGFIYVRKDFQILNGRGQQLHCSLFVPEPPKREGASQGPSQSTSPKVERKGSVRTGESKSSGKDVISGSEVSNEMLSSLPTGLPSSRSHPRKSGSTIPPPPGLGLLAAPQKQRPSSGTRTGRSTSISNNGGSNGGSERDVGSEVSRKASNLALSSPSVFHSPGEGSLDTISPIGTAAEQISEIDKPFLSSSPTSTPSSASSTGSSSLASAQCVGKNGNGRLTSPSEPIPSPSLLSTLHSLAAEKKHSSSSPLHGSSPTHSPSPSCLTPSGSAPPSSPSAELEVRKFVSSLPGLGNDISPHMSMASSVLRESATLHEGCLVGYDTCILLLHAHCGSRVDASESLDVLFAYGFPVFTMDFGGSGKSEGQFVSLGYYEKDDVTAAVNYIRSLGVLQVVLWGRSMGAVASILYCAEEIEREKEKFRTPRGLSKRAKSVVCGMILDSAFSSLEKLALEVCPFLSFLSLSLSLSLLFPFTPCFSV